MKNILMLCAVLAFALRASGQAQVQKVPVVVTSDYYAQPKVLVLHALNNSGKDITGYTMIIRHKNADGTLDENGRSETTSDMLNVLIISQMAKDPTASERIRQQNIGNSYFPAGTGIFTAGENRDMTLTGINSGSELDVVAGVVFYADGSYEKSDEDAFKRLLTMRQSGRQQMKEQDEVIRNALADTTNEHPVAAVLTELNKRRAEAMEKPNHMGFFPMDLGSLRYLQQPGYGEQKGKTERERLTQYVEDEEKRVELMTPHCHLEITVQDKK
jgi:hypothetical protein